MKNKILKITEIIMITIIILVCSISLLQNETIFGYHSYIITSNSTDKLQENDLILVKETDIEKIDKKDIIAYKQIGNEVITSEVEKIIKNNNEVLLKTENSLVNKDNLYGKYQYKFTIFNYIYKIIKSKIGFALCVLIPFITLIIIELLNICKLNQKKEIKLEETKIIDNKEELKEIIETKIEEVKKTKKESKKIEQTIQIPLLEIQKQIKESNNKEKNNNLEDTVVLFNKEDIKEVIKKELSTKTVDKKKKATKKSTESVEN